ncbi:2-dehydropantoate 2-reductase [Streptococcus mutans]|nr:2-dehydropantoate 2-reductase [Streptococcus mutans]
MKILVIGLGTIGSIYGYVFQKAGHEVEHYLRKDSPKAAVKQLQVDLLDGRADKDGIQSCDVYQVKHCSSKTYDFIFVSVPSGGLTSVIDSLAADGISGTLILACGIWEDRAYVDKLVKGYSYILGYPVAGGNIRDNRLTCCLFDHFMLERKEKAAISNYEKLAKLFADCQIQLEQPYDMLEWIWLHMGINAGVISVMGKSGDVKDTAAAAKQLMDSIQYLKEAVNTIRETSQIVASRGVNLKHYKNELLAYKLPTVISAPLMKRMFAKKVLTRKIMTLHGNTQDLMFVCKCLYDSGKKNQIAAPNFYANCKEAMGKITSLMEKK